VPKNKDEERANAQSIANDVAISQGALRDLINAARTQ
jgi:hypothetical protein